MTWARTEVDGVPVHWAGGDGDLTAVLAFRVGMADESLPLRGITHLIEHLAMFALGAPVHEANGQVDAIITMFGTTGDAGEVARFIAGVCGSLHALPLNRLETENQVLRTEAAGRSVSLMEPLLRWRYGAATYGLPGYAELGVGRHRPDQVTAWAKRWFTRDNAVLVLAGGPPPPGLTLDLPGGERVPPPVPSSALPRTPAYFVEDGNVVAMNAVVPRSVAANAYTRLLDRRLRQRLRQEAGLSYRTATSYDPRDGGTAHVLACADGLPETHTALIPAFVREIERLADSPAPPGEVTEVVDRLRTARRESPAGMALDNALRELLGAAPLSDGDAETELDAVSPETIRKAADQALRSSLLMLPGSHEPPGGRFRAAPHSSPGTVAGRTLRGVDAPLDPTRLVIAEDGVSLIRGPSYATVRFRDCEAMLAWPDGGRKLIGRDGFVVPVEPTLWAGGSSLPATLDGAVPAERRIPMPERPAEAVPTPATGRYERFRARIKRR